MVFKRPLYRTLSFIILCALALGIGVNCRAAGKNKEPEAGLEKREFTIEKTNGGSVAISAEIARTNDERSRGLMNRPSLPDGEGMLFVFDREQILSFWMRNTLIPLSIAFIRTDGRITEIRDMQALDETTVSSARSVRYALEAPQGWFARMGIGPGDYLRLGNFE